VTRARKCGFIRIDRDDERARRRQRQRDRRRAGATADFDDNVAGARSNIVNKRAPPAAGPGEQARGILVEALKPE
jgi:hypothetical protein